MIILKNKKTKVWQLAILGFVLILCFTSCRFQKEGSSSDPSLSKEEREQLEQEEKAEEEGTETTQEEKKKKEESQAKKDEKKSCQQGPFAVFSGESAIQYWSKLEAVAKSARDYYNNSSSVISKAGKMYHTGRQENIYVPYLCKNAGLDSKYNDFSCDVLLIKGSDLAKFDGSNVPENSMGFGVFTAAKQPNGGKYMISSPEGNAGLLLEGSYRELLRKYNQDHGNVGRLFRTSDTYKRIVNFVRVYEGRYDKFDVRDVRADGKYAVVVFSPKENPNDIREYILLKDNNFWEVVIDNLEREYSVMQAVNRKLPDFNLALLPSYTIANYKNNFKADFSDVHQTMTRLGMLESADQIYYQCGTTNYCYIMLYNGTKYVGQKTGNSWTMRKVSSDVEGIDTIRSMGGGEAPTFVVLDEA